METEDSAGQEMMPGQQMKGEQTCLLETGDPQRQGCLTQKASIRGWFQEKKGAENRATSPDAELAPGLRVSRFSRA